MDRAVAWFALVCSHALTDSRFHLSQSDLAIEGTGLSLKALFAEMQTLRQRVERLETRNALFQHRVQTFSMSGYFTTLSATFVPFYSVNYTIQCPNATLHATAYFEGGVVGPASGPDYNYATTTDVTFSAKNTDTDSISIEGPKRLIATTGSEAALLIASHTFLLYQQYLGSPTVEFTVQIRRIAGGGNLLSLGRSTTIFVQEFCPSP